MPSGLVIRTMSKSVVRRLAPWAVVLLVGGLLIGVLPLSVDVALDCCGLLGSPVKTKKSRRLESAGSKLNVIVAALPPPT